MEGCEQLYLFRNPNFIKGAIDDGWYIYTDADMFYIDGNPFFKMSHFAHDMMIYGYEMCIRDRLKPSRNTQERPWRKRKSRRFSKGSGICQP